MFSLIDIVAATISSDIDLSISIYKDINTSEKWWEITESRRDGSSLLVINDTNVSSQMHRLYDTIKSYPSTLVNGGNGTWSLCGPSLTRKKDGYILETFTSNPYAETIATLPRSYNINNMDMHKWYDLC